MIITIWELGAILYVFLITLMSAADIGRTPEITKPFDISLPIAILILVGFSVLVGYIAGTWK